MHVKLATGRYLVLLTNVCTSLLRGLVEWVAWVIWSPNYYFHVEAIQKRFLLIALCDLGWDNNKCLLPNEHRFILFYLVLYSRHNFYFLLSMFLIQDELYY